MMKKSIISLTLSFIFVAAFLTGCGSNDSSTTTDATTASNASAEQTVSTPDKVETIVLKVGATPAPHAEILEFIKNILAEQGIELEITEFNDYIMPNTALDDGSLDANFFQHLPYLENFNVENNTDLVSVAGIHIEPYAIYPGRVELLEDLPNGAQIGIPNDPTNEGRALLLLQDLGLITLKADAGLEATPRDIEVDGNPNNINFIELEAAQLPVSLPDLDFAVINGNYAIEAGIRDTALETEGAESPYVNVIAVRSGDEKRPEILALITALQSDEVRNFIIERYEGEVIPIF